MKIKYILILIGVIIAIVVADWLVFYRYLPFLEAIPKLITVNLFEIGIFIFGLYFGYNWKKAKEKFEKRKLQNDILSHPKGWSI
jgi:NADH:ubiquinone oxidoreductase subunit 3 (subunit A)